MPDGPVGDLSVILKFFRQVGDDIKSLTVEMKKLTDTDKKQLADGIRSGELTY